MRCTTYVRMSACLSAVVLGPAVPAAHADELCPPARLSGERIPSNGFVREKSIGGPTRFRIDWTDRSGAQIGLGSVERVTKPTGGNVFLSDVIKAPSALGTGAARTIVCDFVQTTERIGNTGELNVLSVEALVFDPPAGVFATANIFEAVAAHIGGGVWVPIPDLYADTDGDGTLDIGDVLYSAVDLNEYLPGLPTFSLGQSFDIVDGRVLELPGMWFSSTPITFDPLTGEFTGTPISIEGSALSSHEVASIPEPATLCLLGGGVALLPLVRRRRRG